MNIPDALYHMLTAVEDVAALRKNLKLLRRRKKIAPPVVKAIDEISTVLDLLGRLFTCFRKNFKTVGKLLPEVRILIDAGFVYRRHTFSDGLLFFVGANVGTLGLSGCSDNQWIVAGGFIES